MRENIKFPHPYYKREQSGFDRTVPYKADTADKQKKPCTDNGGPFFPGFGKANVDDIADQKKTDNDAVPDDLSDVTVAIDKAASYRNQAEHIPQA